MNNRGFTLIEILLATAILAAGMALAFATVHSATLIGQRDGQIAVQMERMRSLEQFFRQSLRRSLPLSMGHTALQEQSLFVGANDHLRFVTELVDGLGRGGTYVFDLFAVQHNGATQLRLTVRQRLANKAVAPADVNTSEVIASDLRHVQFRYRGLDSKQNGLGPWLDEWPRGDKLPTLVSIQVKDAVWSWPEMIVALPLASNGEAGP